MRCNAAPLSRIRAQLIGGVAARLPELAEEGNWQGLHRGLQLLLWLVTRVPGASTTLAQGRSTAFLQGGAGV
jgi:hypothetical protein